MQIQFKLKYGQTRTFSIDEHGENWESIAVEFENTNKDQILNKQMIDENAPVEETTTEEEATTPEPTPAPEVDASTIDVVDPTIPESTEETTTDAAPEAIDHASANAGGVLDTA